MRKNKNELLRLQTMIENDRISTGDDFIELIVSDATALLKDFFDFNDVPSLNIVKFGDRYKVELSVLVSRIKNFSSIPKQ